MLLGKVLLLYSANYIARFETAHFEAKRQAMTSLISGLQKFVRFAAATVFVLAGTFKLFAPFGDFLAQMNVPLPQVMGRAVPLLEICGGAVLFFAPKLPRLLVQLFALALAIDMVSALLLVGAPGLNGKTHIIASHQIGGEKWRVPLEIFLLFVTLWIALRGSYETSRTR